MQLVRNGVTVERSIDLVRRLLFAIEADKRLNGYTYIAPDETDNFGVLDEDQYSLEEVSYVLDVLIEHKLVRGKREVPPRTPSVAGLEWEGHELAAILRSDTVFEKAKAYLLQIGVFSVTMLGKFALNEAMKLAGLPPQ